MSLTLAGQPAARGIAIGRAVLAESGTVEVAREFIAPEHIEAEIARLHAARQAVTAQLQRLREHMPAHTPAELAAMLDVHLMFLQDETLAADTARWVRERHYNAEWALATQLEALSRQFDEMDDAYLRERKTDLAQVARRVLRQLRGAPESPVWPAAASATSPAAPADDPAALVLVAPDLSPAEMLQFNKSVFAGFVTDIGSSASHTAIAARSLDIPAVVGVAGASQRVRPDDLLIIDGDAGLLIINPAPAVLADYRFRRQQSEQARQQLARLRSTPAITRDGQPIELLANIEQAADTAAALAVGAQGIGLLRSEFLFMGRQGQLPGEDEQYAAYRAAVQGMGGLPVTIRTVDVGADKPLNERQPAAHNNPALGLRAIRWCLSEPAMFLTQLRAIFRAAAHGPVQLLIPMLAQPGEIRQTLELIAKARAQLQASGQPHGPCALGAMIEIPAAALSIPLFLQHFDFVSIGTNDLVQYTLAIDRGNPAVAHLYDPLNPAVLGLIASVIAQCRARGKPVSVCGEMAGDAAMTALLLGLGLRSFSMPASRILAVKQQILQADTALLTPWAQTVLASDHPADCLAHPPSAPPETDHEIDHETGNIQ
ncbi:MAG: phosphoenolpyruvate--protein phosphotransferase [Ottowia sp.]